MAQLDGVRHLVPAGARAPLSFFAHPGLPGLLTPDNCRIHTLATTADDIPAALGDLADTVWRRPFSPDPTSVTISATAQALPVHTGHDAGHLPVQVSLLIGGRHTAVRHHAPGHLDNGPIDQPRPRRCLADRDGHAPCTPSRRCGPMSARGSTSPP